MVAITRKRGDTYADEITVKSKATGLPINITGYTFTMTLDPLKDPLTATNNLYSLVGTIIDAPAGGWSLRRLRYRLTRHRVVTTTTYR